MTRQETAQIMAVLGAAFPHVSMSRETIEVYHDALEDVDFAAARRAVRELLRVVDRWPSPAQIRRAAANLLGILAPDSGEAWADVLAEARRIGLYGEPAFRHEAIRATVSAIGWRNICTSEMPDTLRAHFLRLYDEHRKRQDHQTLTHAIGAQTRQELGA